MNFWKSFLHARLCLGLGDRGALTLFNATPEEHRHCAEQLCAERPVLVEANGRKIMEWTLLPGGVENHLLDVLVGCCVAASERGCTLPGEELMRFRRREFGLLGNHSSGLRSSSTRHRGGDV